MAPWRQALNTDTPLSPTAGALAAAVGIATDNAVLMSIWVAFVILDFVSAAIRVFRDGSERWSGAAAIQGMAKKAGYFAFALVAGLLDLAAGELISPGVAELGLLTKGTLALLIGIESGSVLRNLQVVTGEWRLFKFLMRARDALNDPDAAAKRDRWYDGNDDPPRGPS